jgi:hypothetical protein
MRLQHRSNTNLWSATRIVIALSLQKRKDVAMLRITYEKLKTARKISILMNSKIFKNSKIVFKIKDFSKNKKNSLPVATPTLLYVLIT